MSPDDEKAADRDVRSPWRGAKWLAGALAIAVNVVGIVDIAVNNRLVVSVVAGVLAIVGGVWLWRQPRDGSSLRVRQQMMALSVAMIVTGTGVVGYVLARQLAGDTPDQLRGARQLPSDATGPSTSAMHDPTGSPSSAGTVSPPAPAIPSAADSGSTIGTPPNGKGRVTPKAGTPTAAAPTVSSTRSHDEWPFTGTIVIRQPQFGWTLASGGNLSGEVTGWTSGYQVWMSARAEGGSTELVQGPCPVNGSTFVCSGVELPGATGTREYISVAVLTGTQAAQLSDASPLSAADASASDQTQIYKG